MPTILTHNAYGKSAVRLTKVVRNGPVHDLFEIDAAIQLEGDFSAAYTNGDNRNVIATDTIKNTVYVLAKENAFDSIERFALVLATHFPKQYPWVTKATVELHQSAWRRIDVNQKPHDHAFTSDGPHQFYSKVVWSDGNLQPQIGGIRGLLVLKTTASEWRDFHADRYRTLKDTRDRIMATKVDADWTYNTADADFPAASSAIRRAILTTFATHYSLGVQQTLLAMGEAALAACQAIDTISFELPNLHRIPFNLEPFGLTFENDVFVATDEPFGFIKGTVRRNPSDSPPKTRQ
jgi:urate oxidase